MPNCSRFASFFRVHLPALWKLRLTLAELMEMVEVEMEVVMGVGWWGGAAPAGGPPTATDLPTHPLALVLFSLLRLLFLGFLGDVGYAGRPLRIYVFANNFLSKVPTHSLSLSLSLWRSVLSFSLCPQLLLLILVFVLFYVFFSFSLAFPWAILQAEKFQKFFKIFSITFSSSSYPYRRFLTSNLRVGLVSVFFF